MATTGTVDLDFGALPGAMDTSVAITGQASILTTHLVEAWVRMEATADHTTDDHMVDPPRVIAGTIVAGTGFTIYGFSQNETPLYGKYKIAWVWN